jgi:VWFA-related protein
MPNRPVLHSRLVALATIFSCFWVCGQFTLAQTSPQGSSKHKDFGSSLQRLKWDPNKRVVIEGTKQGKKDEAPGEQDDVVRIETTLVTFDILVLDKQGRSIHGLSPSDFSVTEDGQPQQITTFALGDDVKQPKSLVLILDYNGGLLPYINTSVEAAKTLVDQLGPADRMAIVTHNVSLLVGFTSNKPKLKRALDSIRETVASLEPLGQSRPYSALMAALRELMDGQQRPIVIFQTDGNERAFLRPLGADAPPGARANAREFGIVDVVTAAEKARATIYTVIPGRRLIGLPPDVQVERAKTAFAEQMLAIDQRGVWFSGHIQGKFKNGVPAEVFNGYITGVLKDQAALEGLSKLTGGWPEFLEEPSQAGQIYSRILSDMNQRYVLGYQPANKEPDGKRRKVSIEVRDHPEYVIRGRKWYYPRDH